MRQRDFKPTALERRNKDRVAKALDHITRLNEVEGANRRLRSIALEANIRHWLLQHASQSDRAKPEVAKNQAERLHALLFDESTGALHRASQDTMLNKLSRMDLQGVLALHQLAMDRAIDSASV